MKIDLCAIMQTVIAALLVAVLTAGVQTYIEVKMLRKDIQVLQNDLEQLWVDSNDHVQKGK